MTTSGATPAWRCHRPTRRRFTVIPLASSRGVQPLQNVRIGGYPAFSHRHWPFVGGIPAQDRASDSLCGWPGSKWAVAHRHFLGVGLQKALRMQGRSNAMKRHIRSVTIAVSLGAGIGLSSGEAEAFYQQTNLVSDLPGVARFQDTNLVNPWGLSSGGGPIWVSDNGTGVATLY